MSIEVLSHRFLHLLVFDVMSVAIEADVQAILCRTNVLLLALPALYEIDHTLRLAYGMCAHLVGFSSDFTSERVGHFDMSTIFTASLVTWPVSIFPGSCGDGDKHFHLDIPFFTFFFIPFFTFFLLLFIWRKKRTHKKQRLGASLSIMYVYV